MLKNKFKIKFTKDLIKYALIIFFLIALIYAVLSFSLIKYQQQIQITQLQHNASNINDRISTVFDYINNVNVFIGTQIVKSGGKDLNKIYDLFTDVKYHHDKYKNLFSWTLFDWVDENNLQLVNTKKGIAENPSDMSHREYTRTAKLRPWKLQASPPVIGNPSGEWVIPVGTGVIDDQQKYLGVIVLGININELFSKIKTSTDTNVEYFAQS